MVHRRNQLAINGLLGLILNLQGQGILPMVRHVVRYLEQRDTDLNSQIQSLPPLLPTLQVRISRRRIRKLDHRQYLPEERAPVHRLLNYVVQPVRRPQYHLSHRLHDSLLPPPLILPKLNGIRPFPLRLPGLVRGPPQGLLRIGLMGLFRL